MSRTRDVAFALASVVFGATWIFAAAAKIVWPLGAYEFAARVVPPGVPAKAALIVTITAEALLGAAMALRAIGAVRGFVLSLVGLAVACGALFDVRAKAGEFIQCGCYGDALSGSFREELARNEWMAGVLALLIVWRLIDRSK